MKLVKGDIIRNPWVSDPNLRDTIFLRRGSKYVYCLRTYKGLVEKVLYNKRDVDERFAKVGHSIGFDTMVREVTGEETTK